MISFTTKFRNIVRSDRGRLRAEYARRLACPNWRFIASMPISPNTPTIIPSKRKSPWIIVARSLAGSTMRKRGRRKEPINVMPKIMTGRGQCSGCQDGRVDPPLHLHHVRKKTRHRGPSAQRRGRNRPGAACCAVSFAIVPIWRSLPLCRITNSVQISSAIPSIWVEMKIVLPFFTHLQGNLLLSAA